MALSRPTAKLVAAALALSPVVGCKPAGDPKSAKYWVEKVQNAKGENERKSAVEKLAAVAEEKKDAETVSQLVLLLKGQPGDVVERVARALGKIGDKSAVPQLAAAIDLSKGGATDKGATATNRANQAIAEVLGQLGDPSAASALEPMLKGKDQYGQIAAIDALGALKAPSSAGPLAAIAGDTSTEPFITKKAIIALGNVGQASAVPTLHQMLFKERRDRGISFFAESSFALFQIGKPSVAALMPDLDGGDDATKEFAKKNDILAGAVIAKAAQILGDLVVKEAEPKLLTLLAYKDSDAAMQYAVRMQAVDALARMRSSAAVKPIAAQLEDPEANFRATSCRALTFIGDASVVPQLGKSAASGSASARQFAYKALAMIGSDKDAKAFDAVLKDEEKREKEECKEQEMGEPECGTTIKAQLAKFAEYRAVLNTGCASGDVACWSGKLKGEKSPYIRQRAALELGRSGKAEVWPALAEAIQKKLDGASVEEITEEDNARFYAIQAAHWLLDAGMKPADATALIGRFDKQVDEEKKKTATQRSAEDVRRLSVRIARGS